MARLFMLMASFAGFLSVALGAFAAHGLENILTQASFETFKTGVQYQMFHVPALLVVGLLGVIQGESIVLKWSGWLFGLGIVLFSGSLYGIGLSGIRMLGIITPIGGVAFLIAWALLFYSVLKLGGKKTEITQGKMSASNTG